MSETCLSLYFKLLLLLVVSIFVFGIVGVLILVVLVFVGVGGAFIFLRDGHFLRQIQICIAK